ncbi:MAG: uroporphyrinogen-III C-methyltransferase [Betaproteobacteria bacterium]|nr:uroporphyrinogen-III C-methyltransferase [Betaproteobacteria bacterium]NBY05919.1 uroporphyrinogen-III C-methyltransferase [Betaproteobacteria bacterium]
MKPQPHKPKVRLVGAGPGDPEMLTLKALKALQSASLILVDDLVGEDILSLANRTARVIKVGKRGGCRSTPQAFIHKLMVQAALSGENVVRLKGGDPLIFGRGGEEIDHLRSAGIEVEIINGITSALAGMACQQIALTHRDHAQGVVFVTGHRHASGSSMPWADIARAAHTARLTLVIYMGLAQLDHIQSQLLEGLPASTPVALLQNISLPSQRHAITLLSTVSQCAAQQEFSSPTVIVVGEVLTGIHALGLAEDTLTNAHQNQT